LPSRTDSLFKLRRNLRPTKLALSLDPRKASTDSFLDHRPLEALQDGEEERTRGLRSEEF
jgi:hypothetical protein